MNRSVRSLFKAIVLLVGTCLLIVGFGYFHHGYGSLEISSMKFDHPQLTSPEQTEVAIVVSEPALRTGDATLVAQATPYLRAIMNSSDTTLSRLECPSLSGQRYSYLKKTSAAEDDKRPKYVFALDLHQCVNLLPRLLGSIVEAIRFLGPENCVLSIVEGRSNDGTFEVLKELRAEIEGLGSRYIFQSSDINPNGNGTDRIKTLAELRNMALRDLIEHPKRYAEDTTVVFSNDVALCSGDILEIIHQRVFQGADMTCAMDWTYVGEHPTFYDVWIARGMTGDTFFRIPEDGSWDYAWNLFWNDEKAHSRWSSSKPFQVFSCWNGITAFTAKPLMEGKIQFRDHHENECYQGEPKLFAKDMWYHGYGKIAVVPSVNVEYSDEAAKKIKALKGYTSQQLDKEGGDVQIQWEMEPPAKVKCMPGGYKDQTFVPWDEGLPRETDAALDTLPT